MDTSSLGPELKVSGMDIPSGIWSEPMKITNEGTPHLYTPFNGMQAVLIESI